MWLRNVAIGLLALVAVAAADPEDEMLRALDPDNENPEDMR